MSNKLCNWWNTCHIKTSDQSWQMPMNFVDETEALFKEHAAWVMYTNEVPPKGLQRLYNLFLVVWSYRMGLLGYLSLVPSLIVSQKLVKLAACFFMFFFSYLGSSRLNPTTKQNHLLLMVVLGLELLPKGPNTSLHVMWRKYDKLDREKPEDVLISCTRGRKLEDLPFLVDGYCP